MSVLSFFGSVTEKGRSFYLIPTLLRDMSSQEMLKNVVKNNIQR